LLNLFEETKPSMILTELFPFGRRQFRFELIPLLDRAQEAKWKPKIIASMRDILVTKYRQDRNIEISETLNKYYDKVLVHGDEQIITLEETFPLSHEITHLVEYTGYVLNPSISDSKETVGSGEVFP
jgi:predicted glycosyltransferase